MSLGLCLITLDTSVLSRALISLSDSLFRWRRSGSQAQVQWWQLMDSWVMLLCETLHGCWQTHTQRHSPGFQLMEQVEEEGLQPEWSKDQDWRSDILVTLHCRRSSDVFWDKMGSLTVTLTPTVDTSRGWAVFSGSSLLWDQTLWMIRQSVHSDSTPDTEKNQREKSN